MEAEEVVKLFDSCWFEHGIIFKPDHNLIPAPSADFDDQTADESDESTEVGVPDMQIRSLRDRCLGRSMNIINLFKEDAAAGKSASPRSVILKPKLQKILSGKQIDEFFTEVSAAQEKTPEIKRRKKWRKGMRRSLSALEFEEVKAFTDLGFVFDEDDKNSSLVSVIPGLQKLGKNMADYDKEKDGSYVSRPYLSEAWGGVFSERNKGYNNPLMMNWRIPSPQNEINMKDHLKTWAHKVASTVL